MQNCSDLSANRNALRTFRHGKLVSLKREQAVQIHPEKRRPANGLRELGFPRLFQHSSTAAMTTCLQRMKQLPDAADVGMVQLRLTVRFWQMFNLDDESEGSGKLEGDGSEENREVRSRNSASPHSIMARRTKCSRP